MRLRRRLVFPRTRFWLLLLLFCRLRLLVRVPVRVLLSLARLLRTIRVLVILFCSRVMFRLRVLRRVVFCPLRLRCIRPRITRLLLVVRRRLFPLW